MDRRDFLLTTSAAALAGTVGCERKTVDTGGNELTVLQSDVVWKKAPCRYYGTGCGVEVGVNEGKVVAVRGDGKSPVNRGLLCANTTRVTDARKLRRMPQWPCRPSGDTLHTR